MLVEIVWKRPC